MKEFGYQIDRLEGKQIFLRGSNMRMFSSTTSNSLVGGLVAILFFLCLNSPAAILVFNPDGSYTTKATLSAASTDADAANKTVIVTSLLTTNIPAVWPADRTLKIEKGGMINNATPFAINGPFSAGLYQVFASTADITFGGGRTQEVYPEWWGADPAGTTDSSDAIQSAIDASDRVVGSTGAVYLINAPVKVDDNTTVSGMNIKVGPGITVGHAVFQNFTGIFSNPGTTTATKNIKFMNLTVDGQNAGINGTTVPLANMQGAIIGLGSWYPGTGVDGVLVRDCSMKQFAGDGVALWKSTNICVSGNIFLNFFADSAYSIGSPIDCHEITNASITNNKISHTAAGFAWHGITILDWDAGSKNVVVSGNTIRDLVGGGDGISCESNSHTSLLNFENSVIANNVIENCTGQGIDLQYCNGAIISNNTIKSVVGYGIWATGVPSLIITGNNIKNVTGDAIFSNGGTVKAIISDNTIEEVVQGAAIYLYLSTEPGGASAEITGNYIKNIDASAISTISTYANIANNYIYNAGRASTPSRNQDAIIGMGLITDNTVISTGSTRYGFNTLAGDLSSLSNNKFNGTFTGGKIRIGYRAGASVNAVINYSCVEYDFGTDIMKFSATAMPTSGFWRRGDSFEYPAPSAGGYKGMVCTAQGSPGTWKGYGAIAP